MTGSSRKLPLVHAGRGQHRAEVSGPLLSLVRRWPHRPVLVVAGAGLGALTAAALTLVLLPTPPDRQPTALPPPIGRGPAGTASRAPTTPSADEFTPAGAHTVSRQADRPSPPAPPAPPAEAGPPRLDPLPPSRERGLRSLTAERETAIEFVNARDEPVIVYWLDYSGRRVRYRVLGARDSYRQHTYVTHPWVVTRLDGRGLAVFLPRAAPARATVR